MNGRPSCHCGAGDDRPRDTKSSKGLPNTSSPPNVSFLPSTSARQSLARLTRYRGALDAWHSGPPGVPMPRPDQFGLRLDPSSSAVILWRGGGA